MSLGTALKQIADELTAAGAAAAVDARDLNLPGVWVGPGPIDFDRLDSGTFTAEVELYLVVPDVGATQAMNDLIDLMAKVRAIYPVPEARPVTVTLDNHAPGGLPALQITLTITVTQE